MSERRRYADRREELIKAVAKRRRKIKTLSIEYKGGRCQVCGYDGTRVPLIFTMFLEKKNLELEIRGIPDPGKRLEKS